MASVVFFQEDEDVPSVYRNLKIFCETAPSSAKTLLAVITLISKSFTLQIIMFITVLNIK